MFQSLLTMNQEIGRNSMSIAKTTEEEKKEEEEKKITSEGDLISKLLHNTKMTKHFHLHTNSDYILIPRGVVSVTVHPTVTKLAQDAFFRHTHLRSISFPNSVTEIGTHAFDGCSQLKTVIMPISLRSIQDCTFSGCSELESILIPTSVSHIDFVGHYAFYGCCKLSLLSLPSSIGVCEWKTAFTGCNALNLKLLSKDNNKDPFSWLCNRFENLPLHQAFYALINKSTNMQMLESLTQRNKNILNQTDVIGMTPLHILCGNPNATAEMVAFVMAKQIEVTRSRTQGEKTPLMMFMSMRYDEVDYFDEKGHLLALVDLLEKGIDCEVLKLALTLENSDPIKRKNDSGLLPLIMIAASLQQCSLDVLYTMVVNRPDLII